jgi:metal-responsive CopG/Arc/MetJ family transcriptional regulator
MKRRKKPPYQRSLVSLPPDLHAELERLRALGVTRSGFIRRVVAAEFARRRRQAKASGVKGPWTDYP